MKKTFIVIAAVVLIVAGGVVWFACRTGQATERTIEAKTDFYDITATYPVEPWDKDGIMEKFVDAQVGERKEDWQTGGEIYNGEKAVEAQFPDRPKMVYTLGVTYQKFQSAKMGTVSYVFTVGEYTGGANGNETVQAFTFDKNGPVTIESILDLAGSTKDAAGKTVYNDLALSKILEKQALTDPQEFPDKGILDEGLGLSYLKADGVTFDQSKCHCDGFLYASNLQNFAVTDDGLDFFFGKYAITIGAGGVPEIDLDWAALKPYLKTADKS